MNAFRVARLLALGFRLAFDARQKASRTDILVCPVCPVCLLALGFCLAFGAPSAAEDQPAEADDAPRSATEALAALHLQEAERWRMYVDADRTRAAALQSKPIYVWTNPTRNNGQSGAVYVWSDGERPVVLGCIFSRPDAALRRICNEFHSLAPGDLFPERSEGESWRPKASVALQPLPGAAAPEATASRRLIQMRGLAREFSAHSVDFRKERWELRLLTQPLYRYQQPRGETIDGALFAFVTSAGTDPEVVLALEARRQGRSSAWHYRLRRFSDSDLHVRRDGQEIWSSVRDERNQFLFNADHTYRLIQDKAIVELPELKSQTH